MKVLNEKQRADLVAARCKQLWESVHQLEIRNEELERKFGELAEKLISSQAREGELMAEVGGKGEKRERERGKEGRREGGREGGRERELERETELSYMYLLSSLPPSQSKSFSRAANIEPPKIRNSTQTGKLAAEGHHGGC